MKTRESDKVCLSGSCGEGQFLSLASSPVGQKGKFGSIGRRVREGYGLHPYKM